MARPWKVALVLVAIGMVVVLLAGAALVWVGWRTSRVPRGTLLEVELSAPLLEQVPTSGVASLLMEKRMRLRDVVEALHAAAADPRITGLVAHVEPEGLGLAAIEELRDAVAVFRAAGKPTVAWADTFGEITPANGAYYLASAFDHVYIQPSGDVGLTGLELTAMFLRGTLDKIGVTPQFAQRYQYKNAPNSYTETAFTPAHRESMDVLTASIFDHLVDEIARARHLKPEVLRAAIDRGPMLGKEAVDAKLVDGLLYRDEVYERAAKLAGSKGEPRLLYLRKYWERTDGPWSDGGRTIAVVYGVGDVLRGRSDYDPVFGTITMGSQTVAGALRAAAEDDDVAAVVLRVDSPGGSYVASDTIWREVVRTRKRGKPVIASFGDVAASGGYFVAMAADKIVAHPSTITGSIGVYGGKMVTRELWGKLGISFDSVRRGDHADMWSSIETFDEDEWIKFNAWLDRVYADFTTKVAQGRKLRPERVQELARGRVWSGVDALRLGLVDALGGYDAALRLAKQEAGIAPGAKVEIREYPRSKGAFEEIFGESEENSESQASDAALRALEALRPGLRALRDAGVLGQRPPQVLRATELTLR
jgi:protease-4